MARRFRGGSRSRWRSKAREVDRVGPCRTATEMLVMAMAARRQIGRATWFRRPGERVRRLGIEGRQVVLGEPRGVDPQAGKVGVLLAQVFQYHQRSEERRVGKEWVCTW